VRSEDALSSRRAALAGSVLLVLATILLWSVSRGKWSDALIDSGREWIVPDALSRDALLYRDVVYWFGPFTPYFHAAFFRLFGSSIPTLVLAGAVASIAVLSALFFALRRVTGRAEAALWTALAVPALVFMPHAGGSLLGMGYRIWHAAAFALLAVAAASRSPGGRSLARPLASGSLCALAGLCRTEWGLVALAAVVLATAVRERRNRFFWKEAATAGLGFLLVFGGVIGVFVLLAGPKAVLEEGHVLLTGLPEETRTFLLAFSGLRDWRRGIAELLYSSAMWTGAFLLVETLALWKLRVCPNNSSGDVSAGRTRRCLLPGVCVSGGRTRRCLLPRVCLWWSARWTASGPPNPPGPLSLRGGVRALGMLLLALALAALFGGAGGAVLFSAAPFVCLAALVVAAVQRRRARSAALAACGLLGFILSYRRPFHIGDSAYVGPPLLFAFVSAAGLLRRRVARLREGLARRRLLAAFAGALALLVAFAFVGRAVHYATWETVPIAGTGGLLSARPQLAREIAQLAEAIQKDVAEREGLVVFPEGEIVNFVSGRRNPIRHKLYIPGYLTVENEEDVLRELSEARPGAVVIWRRPAGEYGRGFFGEDYARRIRAWIGEEYALRPFVAEGVAPRVNPNFLYGLRREPKLAEIGYSSKTSSMRSHWPPSR